MSKTNKPKPKTKAQKKKEFKDKLAKKARAKAKVKTTVSSKGTVIHNTVNIHEAKKPARKATKPKATPKDTSAYYKPENRETLTTVGMTPVQKSDHKQLLPYQQLEMERQLYRTNNPDRYGDEMNQGVVYPASYPQVHRHPQPTNALTDEEKKMLKQLTASQGKTTPATPPSTPSTSSKPTPNLTSPNIASYPHISGSRDYLVNQIMGDDEKYDQLDENGDVKTWNKTKLKALGTEGLRKFIHDNQLAVEPENKLTKEQRKEKQTKKKKDLLSKINTPGTYQKVHRTKDTQQDKINQQNERDAMANADYESTLAKTTNYRVKKTTTKDNDKDIVYLSKPALIKKVIAKKVTGANGKQLTESQLKHSRYTIAKLQKMLDEN